MSDHDRSYLQTPEQWTRFVSTLTHELRTPLASLGMLAEAPQIGSSMPPGRSGEALRRERPRRECGTSRDWSPMWPSWPSSRAVGLRSGPKRSPEHAGRPGGRCGAPAGLGAGNRPHPLDRPRCPAAGPHRPGPPAANPCPGAGGGGEPCRIRGLFPARPRRRRSPYPDLFQRSTLPGRGGQGCLRAFP